MTRFIVRRLLQAVPTIFGIMLLTFLLTRLSPSDPVTLMVGSNPNVSASDRAALRKELGLDDPLPVQFVKWSANVVRLNFGQSFYYHRSVLSLIEERIPNSLQLSVAGLIVGLLLGVPLGVISALRRGRPEDHGIRVLSTILHSTPNFFLGLLFILILSVRFGLFPVGSMNSVGDNCTFCWDRAWHMVGPVLLLASGGLAVFPRLLRAEMLEILSQDYIRTARSKGLRERVVLYRHALRNVLVLVVSLFGGILTIVIGGSVVVEQVFNWPGLGRLIFEAAIAKDYPLLQASVLIGSLLLVVSYILRDIAYTWVDPRIKVGA